MASYVAAVLGRSGTENDDVPVRKTLYRRREGKDQEGEPGEEGGRADSCWYVHTMMSPCPKITYLFFLLFFYIFQI